MIGNGRENVFEFPECHRRPIYFKDYETRSVFNDAFIDVNQLLLKLVLRAVRIFQELTLAKKYVTCQFIKRRLRQITSRPLNNTEMYNKQNKMINEMKLINK